MGGRVGALVYLSGYANVNASTTDEDFISGLPQSAVDYRGVFAINDNTIVRAINSYSTVLTLKPHPSGTIYVCVVYYTIDN